MFGKKILAVTVAVLMAIPFGIGVSAESGKIFSWNLSGNTAAIRNQDGASLTLDNVFKIEEADDGMITVYAAKNVSYQVNANSFAMAPAWSGGFNQAPGSRYKLYEKKEDGSRGKATGEIIDTDEMLERGIVAIDNPTREEKYWEIQPNHSRGTMTDLSGTYIIQLSDDHIFSSAQRWENDTFYLSIVRDENSSQIADVVQTVPVEGEGQWEYLSNGKRRFLITQEGYSSYASGWTKIAGKWYFFANNWDDGYEPYDMVTGWVNSMPTGVYDHTEPVGNDGYYYLREDGSLQTGWLWRDGWYYLGSDLKYRTGWFLDSDGSWYYLSTSGGKMHQGWLWENGKWYFLGNDGRMYCNGWRPVSPSVEGVVMLGNWEGFHYFRSDGSMATGWQLIQEEWYYFNPDGSRYNGWLLWYGKWYYLQNGVMQTSKAVDGFWLDENGVWIP